MSGCEKDNEFWLIECKSRKQCCASATELLGLRKVEEQPMQEIFEDNGCFELPAIPGFYYGSSQE